MSLKVCTKCNEVKSPKDFPKDQRLLSGLSSQCRSCHAIRSAKSYQANRAKVAAKSRAWQAANPERVRELQRRKNITPEEWVRRRAERFLRRQAEADARRESHELNSLISKRVKVHSRAGTRCPLAQLAGLKQCTKCSCVKPLSEFPQRRKSTDGRDSGCKQCKQSQSKAWVQKNLVHIAALNRKRYRERPDVREKSHARSKVAKFIRKTRMADVVCDLTAAQWMAIKLVYKNRCAYCGLRKPLTQDHIVPVSQGGDHTASNIIPACQSCNSRKNARLPIVSYQPHLIA